MKKILKFLFIILMIIILVISILIVKIITDHKHQTEDQKNMVKTDEELIGEHFYMPRDNKENVDMNLYFINDDEKHPLVINIHGGAFIAGDADTLDTQSQRISEQWNVNVATVNYKLAKDGYDIAYGTQEITDTVKYFISHCDEYAVDPEKIYILGYSAGGYHAMASALQLRKEEIPIKGQIICYGFLSSMIEQYNQLNDTQKQTMPDALFILADDEPIGKGSLEYENALKENGNHTEIKIYEGALHGFIEENNPEYEKLHSHTSKSPEQETMARNAENYMGNWISQNAIS